MKADGTCLEEIPRRECLRLIATVPVGRIIYTRQALPAVELVNFAVDGGDIVIRTSSSGKLAAAIRGAVVAFEADYLDPVDKTGWSVTAIGRSREVSDPGDAGEPENFIRISPEIINGRMLGAMT